jgi:iron complex transport system substrate-binding protein
MIHRRIGGIAAVLLLLFASCGEPTTPQAASPETPSMSAAFPVTITAPNGDVTLEKRPERIVSLSPTATEMLFAIGAGDQVEAVDDQSNYPLDAPMTDLSGFEPNVEAIASYEPDLVVYATEPGDLGASLEGVGIPALQQDAAASLDDVYDQIDQLGMATGHTSEATALVEGMRGDIDAIVDSIEPTEPPLSFYHELDDTYFSVTSSTFIGQLYALTGLVNIADEAKGAGGGYPQLSAEYIIQADPDLIFLADTKCCGQSAATVAGRPGWDQIDAVERGGVISLDDDIASRWGPRVVDYLRRIAAAVKGVPEMNAA